MIIYFLFLLFLLFYFIIVFLEDKSKKKTKKKSKKKREKKLTDMQPVEDSNSTIVSKVVYIMNFIFFIPHSPSHHFAGPPGLMDD